MKKITLLSIVFLISLIPLTVYLTFFSFPSTAQAAAVFWLSPSSGSYYVGETISASIMVSTGGEGINAGQGSASFSSDILEYQSISSSGSIFTFWTAGPSGSSSSISFGGGLPTPGFSGSGGKVVTVTWKAIKAGTATVTVNGSKILANDGAGTNIYSSSSGGVFTIEEPATTTSTTTSTSTTTKTPTATPTPSTAKPTAKPVKQPPASLLPAFLKIFDVDGDGKIEKEALYDAVSTWTTLWKNFVTKKIAPDKPIIIEVDKCDFNSDGECNTKDFSILLYYVEPQ